ncbi:hypothetical protein B0H16DRAFT_818570 [Mycena metata]|uniref:Uncharacterized protein n=1 Tax=Mycena metata TaxID=1033252 RepID=A0AAD7DRY3_9AGAR|nr:hypothetical protein B0H16DRAFT_818570 [Mycena metata]
MDEGHTVNSESTSTEGRFPPVNLGLTSTILPPPTTMGTDAHSIAQYASVNEGGSASNAGAFFPNSKDFVITGGVFTSNTHVHNLSPPPPSDFPTIPLGYLDLRHEIRLKPGSNTVHLGHSHGLRSTRKIYSARITGVRSKMTVAVHQGQAAEEQEISQYARLRHPNLIQLFGTVSTAGLHAAVYHDELIPVKRIREERLRASHLSLAYFLTSMTPDFEDARYYVEDVDGTEMWSYYCTLWIRPSNGRLCVDLTLVDDLKVTLPVDLRVENPYSGTFPSGISLLEQPEDSQMIAALSLDDYHAICSSDLCKDATFSIPTHTLVIHAAIYRRTSGTNLDNLSEIAYIPEWQFTGSPRHELSPRWYTWGPNQRNNKHYSIMESGWTRVDSSEAEEIRCVLHTLEDMDPDQYWFAQADHIFNRLGIKSNYEDYVMVSAVRYWVKISEPRDTTPPCYLFLCPLGHLRPDTHSGTFNWLAYWSFDPTGFQRLSADEARVGGLPTIEVGKEVDGIWWDSTVYDGIRQFHEAKGFDPDTQDVAEYLGYPLFKLSSERDEKDNSSNENEDHCPMNCEL